MSYLENGIEVYFKTDGPAKETYRRTTLQKFIESKFRERNRGIEQKLDGLMELVFWLMESLAVRDPSLLKDIMREFGCGEAYETKPYDLEAENKY